FNFTCSNNDKTISAVKQKINVVWKSSTELGVGLATDGNTVFVVGKYKPAGNMNSAGYFEKNVLPKTE
uniref:SCP domain-containing protein n=1 Tax=Sinocyclocheilus grahami TaxID=75366 RepID=A0A672LEN8_SINGR